MKKYLLIIFTVCTLSTTLFAGNPDRIGEGGAPELLMNGWARSTGMWDLNTARITGIEAIRLNPAGLSFVNKMQVSLAQTFWFAGSGVSLTQGGFASKLGADNVIGVTLMSANIGNFYRTTESNPDPNNSLGSFKPSFFNIGLSFSRTFSSRIHAGATVRLISENVENVSSFGFAIDAGIQYVLGKKENLRFGVSVRNLGTPMKFSGDGFSFRGQNPDGGEYDLTYQPTTKNFQLPALLTLGASYDFWLGNEYRCNGGFNMHRLTLNGSYISNTYGKDNFGLGAEYAFKEMFMVRAGYKYEGGNFNVDTRTTIYSGFAAGFTAEVPFKVGGPSLGIDYSYRHTYALNGTHSVGLTFSIGDKENNPCLSTKEKEEEKAKDAFNSETVKKVRISKKEKAELERISAAINFETASSNLTTDSKETLNSLIEFMNKKKNAKIQIDAYTDSVGNEDDNLSLSRERAFAVKTYLMDNGVVKDRLKSKGHGESDLFDNSTEEGRAKNRRVVISIR
ncbi:MAG: PorV/PorQ family protein [Chitinophagales bacterium]